MSILEIRACAIAAPKRDVQRARDDAIGCKRSLPGQQTRVLDALDPRADVPRPLPKDDINGCQPECSLAIVRHGGPACSVRAIRVVETADHLPFASIDRHFDHELHSIAVVP